jgi:hypothetical protein
MKNGREWFEDRDARFDRLVDGELGEEEFRDFVASLDEIPDGWRRCALTFLESQAWQREMSTIRDEATDVARPGPRKVARTTMRRLAPLALTAAASFLLALALGSMAWRPPRMDDSLPRLVDRQETGPAVGPADGTSQFVSADRETDSLPSPDRMPSGKLTLFVDRKDGGREAIELPVFDMENGEARQLIANTISIPRGVERALQGMGYQVHTDRQWTPVPVEGSRRVYVPIDQWKITPVSGRSYH